MQKLYSQLPVDLCDEEHQRFFNCLRYFLKCDYVPLGNLCISEYFCA